MTCIIFEDEKAAAERLKELIKKYDSSIEIKAVLPSVEKALDWFKQESSVVDLIFADIQLSDGLSFEIFEQAEINIPVIFTTAYNEYALKAFKTNSIDYLLKPIDSDELTSAFIKLKNTQPPTLLNSKMVQVVYDQLTNNYKRKFIVKVGEHIRVFKDADIQCFYSMQKGTYLQNLQGRDFAVNFSLDQLEECLDPKQFFRINRKYIVSAEAITDIIIYSNSRLFVKLATYESDDLVVSREKVNAFKEWLES